MSDKEENDKDELETISFGSLKASLSRESMKMIMPFVGWSLLISSTLIAVAAIIWGTK